MSSFKVKPVITERRRATFPFDAFVKTREFAGTDRLLERHARYKPDKENDGIFALQFSHKGTNIAIGCGDGTIQVIDSNSATVVKELRVGRSFAMPIMTVRFHPRRDNELWASSAAGSVYVNNIESGTCQEVLTESGNEIDCLCFSRHGDTMITAGRDHALRLYDTETRQISKVYPGVLASDTNLTVRGHSSKILAIKHHPVSPYVFLSGGWDNVVGIWDRRTPVGLQRHIYGPHICGDGIDIKSDLVLTASWVFSNALQLWDFGSGKLVKDLPLKETTDGKEYLYCCRFSGTNRAVAGGSGAQSIQVVKIKSPRMECEVPFGKSVYTLDVERHTGLMAVGGAGKKVLILNQLKKDRRKSMLPVED